MKKAVVFSLLIFGISQLLTGTKSLPRDEAWLVSALAAILVVYWVPPTTKEKYLTWTITKSALVVGTYLFLFKVPLVLAGFMNYYIAIAGCLLIYVSCCWFAISRKNKPNDTPT